MRGGGGRVLHIIVSMTQRGGARGRAMPSEVLLKAVLLRFEGAIQLTAWMHSWAKSLELPSIIRALH